MATGAEPLLIMGSTGDGQAVAMPIISIDRAAATKYYIRAITRHLTNVSTVIHLRVMIQKLYSFFTLTTMHNVS